MVNTDANEVVAGRGESVNCGINGLVYEEFYRAVNAGIKGVSRR